MKTAKDEYSITAYVTRQTGGHYTYRVGMSGQEVHANGRADAIARATAATADVSIRGVSHRVPVARIIVTDDQGAAGGAPFLSSGQPAYAVQYNAPSQGRAAQAEVIDALPAAGSLLP